MIRGRTLLRTLELSSSMSETIQELETTKIVYISVEKSVRKIYIEERIVARETLREA